LFVSVGLWAQTTVAIGAQGNASGVATAVAIPGASRASLPAAPGRVVVEPAPAKKAKLFDRSYKTWMLASFAATVVDIETTAHGLGACGLVETNPLLGRTPSRAKMYGIGLPMTAGYNLLALWVKRRTPHSRVWMIIPGAMTAVHAGAAGHNLALCH
jgi:hypothetical protein